MKKLLNQQGSIHTLPLLLIIAAVGVISFLLITSTAPLGGISGVLNPKPASHAAAPTTGCGLTNPAFCDTFDQPMGTGNRSGQLNGDVWGVSRIADQNLGGPANGWLQVNLNICGQNQTVLADNDIFICNGQMQEGFDDGGGVVPLTIYPKQPFDFAGRTGKVTFDVSNDSQGNHGAWPEFWMTDKPVPGPFTHEESLQSLPQNGFGIRFAGCTATCPEGADSVGVDSAITVSNYVENDSFNGGNLQVESLDSVKKSAPGQLNHYEIDISQNQIDVYATDGFSGPLNLTNTPLKHIATIPNANLNFTRGLIWIEDVHYNGNKFGTQSIHTFTWDNVGFDGPILPRDVAYDVNDKVAANGHTSVYSGLPEYDLGWAVGANTPQTFTLNNVSLGSATGGLLTFGFWYEATPPFSINYAINGHTHTLAWPYPDNLNFTPKTIGIPIALSDIQAGTNTITITPAVAMNIFNIDLIMVAGGGIPCSINPSEPCNGSPLPTSSPAASPAPSGCAKAALGDINCDGAINIFDYSLLVGNFNKSGTGIQGDLNNDGIVNIQDYNILLTNFGK